VEEPIASLPGVSRWSVDGIARARERGGCAGHSLPGAVPQHAADRRSEDGREALNPDNLMCRAIRAIKRCLGDDIGVLTDVALDPYTSHGQDGLIDAAGYVLNDATVEVLVGQALNQAAAGADIIAPSDMMDGRIGAIRAGAGRRGPRQCPDHVLCRQICLGLLWPVPRCGRLGGLLKGDKKDLPDGPGQRRGSAARSRARSGRGRRQRDGQARPALSRHRPRVKAAFRVPVFAYQVSGEYAMIEAAVAAGAGERDALVLETLLAFKRAGCSGVLTYHAPMPRGCSMAGLDFDHPRLPTTIRCAAMSPIRYHERKNGQPQ
jgi:porphobilinogen synthase